MRSIIIALQLWLLGMGISTVQAGMPNFLMWIGKEQDALIVGEIIKKISPEKQQVKVLAVFPQTKDKSVDVGKTIPVKIGGSVGDKLLLSLNQTQNAYQVKWDNLKLTSDTTDFSNARLVEQGTVRDDYQLMLSTAGKYLTPDELFQKNTSLEKAQIPDTLLKQIPTRELLKVWLVYPQITSIHAFNTPQQGMDKLRQSFNALPELLNRADVADELLKLFDESDLGKFGSVVGDKNIIDFMNQQTALVLLLAQPEVIGQLSFYQKVILEWNVSKHLDALAKNDALTKSLLPSIYQLLATNLKKD
ncbi:MAG: hypothetical protein RI964_1503 [Pseudomonadota bacterium]|jgi:hypothetical protein